MIAYIKGKLLKKTLNSLIIEVNGLGYEVFVPNNYLDKYQIDTEISLATFLHIREDSWNLYGFTTWEEREFFLNLIDVSGVGPKAALSIISNASINDLKSAIASEDINFLTKVPGIGKKTAQRIIIELKEKMKNFITVSRDNKNISYNSNVFTALIQLGYQSGEINNIYPKLIKDYPDADEATLIKKALQLLAKL